MIFLCLILQHSAVRITFGETLTTSTTSTTPTTTEKGVSKLKERSVKIPTDIDFREFSPDDLTKLLKLQKEKSADDLKNRFALTNKESNSKPMIIQQTEDNDNSDKSKRPLGFPDISSIFPNGIPANIPYVPTAYNNDRPIQMIATTPDKTQLECECFVKGSRPSSQGKFPDIFQQPAPIPHNPFVGPAPNPFARKPKPFSHRKPKLNPFEALLMGFIKKPSHKRKPVGPFYPQPMPMMPAYPSYFFPNQIPDFGYGVKGKTPKRPSDSMLPPSPGDAIKGSFINRGSNGDSRAKWYWNLEQYKNDG